MLRLAIESDEPATTTQAGWSAQLAVVLGPRGFRAALAAAVVLGLSLLVVSGLPGRLGAWVHDRPEYAWSISGIELDPPPPPWLRSGRDGLLAAASEPLEGFDGGSALDLDLGAVERAFKNVCWVDRVREVRRSYPDRVAVALDYRRPVAIARPERPDPASPDDDLRYLVDGSGVILARMPSNAEVDSAALPELIALHRLAPPAVDEPGTTWSRPRGPDRPAEADPAALAAAALARFLVESADRDGWPVAPDGEELRIHQIHLIDGDPQRLILAHARQDRLLWIYWGVAPGREAPGQISAEEKWRMLRDWIGGGLPELPAERGAYVFTARGPSWQREDAG